MTKLNETSTNNTSNEGIYEFPTFNFESKVDEMDFSEEPIIPLKYN